ncbi:uncharacterized protein CXQ87_000874 [Candidozyma duobushaemuli]|uniref:Uncharacterized protein n=1 Tax=Candidozyma duobushaemuli TaxID=1231522 RepID=A0A2V1AI16_9ASCO|nr:uncharacterized protein CXQ87_000874 [[Candida] duobushaemulonis]PVH17967.1 hypothetical protein CXQ87_000874 [[Candida] duobushaemulonis]
MSGSMSVHSLIDKFSEDEPSKDQRHPRHPGHTRSRSASPAKPQEKPRPDEGTSRLPASASTPHLQQAPYLSPQRPSHFEQHPPYPPRATLDSVLGPQFASIPLTEANLVEALRLRSEQERSRQEQLRLELASRNLAILQTAIQNEVPPHLIPSMCVGSVPESRGYPDHQKRPSDTFAAPDQSHTSQAPTGPGIARQDHDNASPVAPLNYRFGSGSRRPLSPAKIGAAAVANFTKDDSGPPAALLDAGGNSQKHGSIQRALRSENKTADEKPPPAALGATSSIQVKPSPAQPLHKQARMPQPPSQESMTSFQHVIQFHHWKPENPGQPEKSPERSHKRHKSGDMSVDLGHLRHSSRLSTDSTNFKREDPDVSMDTSDVTLQEPPKKHETDTNSETSQSSGRFPHDILSSN